jgi:hypothetical protein
MNWYPPALTNFEHERWFMLLAKICRTISKLLIEPDNIRGFYSSAPDWHEFLLCLAPARVRVRSW